MPDPKVIDVHCPHCNQIIIPSDRMKPLLNWQPAQRHGDKLMVPDIGPAVIVFVKFLCKNCGRFVYFDLGEQKLNILLGEVRHV